MYRYLLRRILQAVPTLLLVTVVTFSITMLLPGDPALAFLGEAQAMDKVAYNAMRQELGLDQPIPVQYVLWLNRALHGDLGTSIRTREPVIEAIRNRFPITLQLTVVAMVIALLVALPVGIISAVRPNSWLDSIGTILAMSGQAVPSFWFGIMLIVVFAVWLGWLPAGGAAEEGDDWRFLVLPVATLAFGQMAAYARHATASMEAALAEPWVRSARARGASENRVALVHALPNASVPLLTLLGLDAGALVSGAVITETLFARPGMGKLIFDAIMGNDYNLALLALLVVAVVTMLGSLGADLAQRALDPRLR